MPHALTYIGYVIHIAGGFIGLLSGTVALLAPKGRTLHRAAGNIFFVSMMLMAGFAIYLGVVIPDQLMNVFGGIFAFYLVFTGWLTVRRRPGSTSVAEKIAALVSICLGTPFVILAFQVATGRPTLFAASFEGPQTIALYSVTAILIIAAFGDAKLLAFGGITGTPRIARHLWRMCLGLSVAAGSGFTNGLARLLPGPYHVPPAFFIPTFIPIVFLTFWLIRVRLGPPVPQQVST